MAKKIELDGDFEAQAKYTKLPMEISAYCQQFLMNLLAAGYTVTSPQGVQMNKNNMAQGLQAWREIN